VPQTGLNAPTEGTRELAGQLARVIVEYEQTHPEMTKSEVEEAARMALQASTPGRSLELKTAAVSMLGVSMFVAVAVVVLAAVGGLLSGPLAAGGIFAFGGATVALIAALRKGDL
jgi:hypothetical protein